MADGKAPTPRMIDHADDNLDFQKRQRKGKHALRHSAMPSLQTTPSTMSMITASKKSGTNEQGEEKGGHATPKAATDAK